MTIRIRYFGQLVEVVGKAEEFRNFAMGTTLNDLELEIHSNHKLNSMYYRIALNQKIEENKEIVLNNNDEVAFMPPFAGG